MTHASHRDRAVAAGLFAGAALAALSPFVYLLRSDIRGEFSITLASAMLIGTGAMAALVGAGMAKGMKGEFLDETFSSKGWGSGIVVTIYTWILTPTALFGVIAAIGLVDWAIGGAGSWIGGERLSGVFVGYAFTVLLGAGVMLPSLIPGAVAGHLYYRYVRHQASANDTPVAPASR